MVRNVSDAAGNERSSRNASDLATEKIRSAILEGHLKPAARLGEVQLAQQFGISRTPVREALQRLSHEGLIALQPNRGAFVRSYTQQELVDLYELRALLEGHAARLAASKLDEAGVIELRASCTRFEALGPNADIAELVAENTRFHRLVVDISASSLLTGMVQQVVKMPLVYKTYVWYSPDQKRASEYYHHQITTALERRDGVRAEAIMREHVLSARDVLLAHLRDEVEAT
jgi:DNA-binding GntR family transcriptional regulator